MFTIWDYHLGSGSLAERRNIFVFLELNLFLIEAYPRLCWIPLASVHCLQHAAEARVQC